MFLKVSGKKAETENIFSIILEKPEDFNFYPGQYLDVKLADDSRAFTVSSSPTERFLMITPKKGISKFKKTLEKLKIGDSINTSHPAGTFTLDESSPAVFIAGGIGITPFRSIIKYVLDNNLNTAITLYYLNSDDNFLFNEELDKWQGKLPHLKVIYHHSSKDGRLNITKLDAAVQVNVTGAIFYLAGAPKMVDDFAGMLLKLGVDGANIRYDRFDGY